MHFSRQAHYRLSVCSADAALCAPRTAKVYSSARHPWRVDLHQHSIGPMSIRDFNLNDHEQVFSVAKDSWKLAYSSIYPIDFLDNRLNDWYSFQNHKGMINDIVAGKLYFKVYTDNEQILGFITGNMIEAFLARLYITPIETRKGIGSTLLYSFIEELRKRNYNKCKTACDQQNSIGLNFYKKNGFKIIDQDEEDFILEKDI